MNIRFTSDHLCVPKTQGNRECGLSRLRVGCGLNIEEGERLDVSQVNAVALGAPSTAQ